MTQGIGQVSITITTDDGQPTTYILHNVLWLPQAPTNILSIDQFSASLNDSETNGNWVKSSANETVFTWDSEQYTTTVKHNNSNIPELCINIGFNE